MFLASLGLAGCPGGGGGGGSCPENMEGTWQVNGCGLSGISCLVEQDGCNITLDCSDGRVLEGKATKSSVNFKDDEVSCSGELDKFEDDDGDGFITPKIEAECEPEGQASCEIEADCVSGDCTIPEDEDDNGGDGDGDGDSGEGGGSGFLGGGNGGDGPAGGGGVGTSGSGGFSGGGQGGISGEGGSPAGSGGVGGSVSGDCGSCMESFCPTEITACTTGNGCAAAADCVFSSGCSANDDACLASFCSGVPDPSDEGFEAFNTLLQCSAGSCASDCALWSSGPVAGSGGVGGEGGAGGVGGEAGGPPLQACDTCVYAGDDVCDDPEYCDPGTDCTDCGNAGQ